MFKQLHRKPYLIFWSLIPVFVIMGLIGIEATIDINIHDIYDVIEFWVCNVIAIAFIALLGLWYWVCDRLSLRLVNWLSMVHAVGTGISLVLTLYFLWMISTSELPRSAYESAMFIPDVDYIIGSVTMLVFSQLAMVINALILLVRRIKILIR